MWKLKRSYAIEPIRATSGSAGYDLFAAEDAWIPPFWWGRVTKVETGVVWEAPNVTGEHLYCQLASRSGLALRSGVVVVGGVIDSDYSGEIGVLIQSTSWTGHQIRRGDRIAQAIIHRIFVDDKANSVKRETGGFGSTGI